jgi:class 3 adenylate cyclase
MVRAAGFYGGYVRNIIGDRVMVIFDQKDCFVNAVNTAILLNTISSHIVNKHFKNNDVRCGIGIDYGKMLVVKTGTVKMGKENPIYKSLVWLGKPANIASKLTDEANKTKVASEKGVRAGYYYPSLGEWFWIDVENSQFLDKLQPTFSPTLRHKDQYFSTFFQTSINHSTYTPAILVTSEVFDGFMRNAPGAPSIINGWWTKQSISIPEYDGDVYGVDVYYLVADEIK